MRVDVGVWMWVTGCRVRGCKVLLGLNACSIFNVRDEAVQTTVSVDIKVGGCGRVGCEVDTDDLLWVRVDVGGWM